MSNYSKFLDDLNDFYEDRKHKGITETISPDEALSAVRDEWIEQCKFKELISFIHTNWDSGNCDDFIRPFEALLIKNKETEMFKQLWTRIIRYRVSALWASLDSLKTKFKDVDTKELESIDTSDFNMYSRDSYNDLKKVVAFHRRSVMEGLTKIKDGLNELGQLKDASGVQTILNDISNLKRIKIKL